MDVHSLYKILGSIYKILFIYIYKVKTAPMMEKTIKAPKELAPLMLLVSSDCPVETAVTGAGIEPMVLSAIQ